MLQQKNEILSTRAFTLVELLIALTILGILAAIALPNFLNARTKAKLAHAQSDMHTLRLAIAMHTANRRDNMNFFYFSSNGICDSYSFLTTPTSYLTDIQSARDVFQTPVWKFEEIPKYHSITDGNGQLIQLNPECYRYLRNILVVRGASIKYKSDSTIPQILQSRGPDGVFGILVGGGIVGYQYPQGLQYDITDGLNSSGDVFLSSIPIYPYSHSIEN